MLSDPVFLVAFGAAALLLLALIATLSGLRSARIAAADLRAEIDSRRRDFDEVQRRADTQSGRLEDRETTIATLREELAEARRQYAETDNARSEANAETARLDEAVRRLEQAASRSQEQMTDLTARHSKLQEAHARLQSDHSALQADTDGKLDAAEKRIVELKELREEMSRRFEELAGQTLRRTGADFSKAHTEKLTELLTPFREHVGRFEAELRNVHKSADEERARLGEQIRHLTQRSEAISAEAVNLTRALKGDKQRQGAWGEMILERLLEDSGLKRDLHYEVQAKRLDEEGGRWRPDVVVKMPRGKNMVIDSKVSLVAYEAAVSADTEADRDRHLREHVASVRRHIDQLSAKGYHAMEEGSVDYVLMFMPIEGALGEAWRQQGDLASYAVAKGVGIMTPTTLMVTLRTVEHIWTVERRESNAEDIAKRAGLLYDKVAGFVANMDAVGRALGQASKAHDDAMGQLSTGRGNVLGQIEKLKSMGARTSKTLAVEFDSADDEEDDDQALLTREPAE